MGTAVEEITDCDPKTGREETAPVVHTSTVRGTPIHFCGLPGGKLGVYIPPIQFVIEGSLNDPWTPSDLDGIAIDVCYGIMGTISEAVKKWVQKCRKEEPLEEEVE